MATRDARFPYRVSRPTARVRLLCLPYAGGTAAIYRTWAAQLPTWIDVCALELPGHGARMRTPAKTTMAELVAAVAEDITDLAAPIAIFGFSLGAVLGYELCRTLRPVHLFVAGSPSPDQPSKRPYSQLSRAELIADLAEWSNTPPEVLANDELMDLLLPIIHADLSIADTYPRVPAVPLDVPITAMTGSADPNLELDEVRGWQRFTTRPFAEPIVLDGGHFFLDTQLAAIQELVVNKTRAALA